MSQWYDALISTTSKLIVMSKCKQNLTIQCQKGIFLGQWRDWYIHNASDLDQQGFKS